jgi:hypothetical protein
VKFSCQHQAAHSVKRWIPGMKLPLRPDISNPKELDSPPFAMIQDKTTFSPFLDAPAEIRQEILYWALIQACQTSSLRQEDAFPEPGTVGAVYRTLKKIRSGRMKTYCSIMQTCKQFARDTEMVLQWRKEDFGEATIDIVMANMRLSERPDGCAFHDYYDMYRLISTVKFRPPRWQHITKLQFNLRISNGILNGWCSSRYDEDDSERDFAFAHRTAHHGFEMIDSFEENRRRSCMHRVRGYLETLGKLFGETLENIEFYIPEFVALREIGDVYEDQCEEFDIMGKTSPP